MSDQKRMKRAYADEAKIERIKRSRRYKINTFEKQLLFTLKHISENRLMRCGFHNSFKNECPECERVKVAYDIITKLIAKGEGVDL
jgi:hypothetical protein